MSARIVIEETECIHGYRRTHHRFHAGLRGLVPCGPERRVIAEGDFVVEAATIIIETLSALEAAGYTIVRRMDTLPTFILEAPGV
jgi:hypothetical protein